MNDAPVIPPTSIEMMKMVKSMSDPNCIRCYGRGYDGFTIMGQPVPCKCFLKNIQKRKQAGINETIKEQQ